MKLPFSKKSSEPDRTIEFAWGGIYAYLSPTTGKYQLFRILHFSDGAVIQESLYQEMFDNVPSAAEVMNLRPFVMHVPIAAESLLTAKNLTLVAKKPLVRDDLEGFGAYLSDAEEASDDVIEHVYDGVLKLNGTSVWLRLSDKDGISVIEPSSDQK